MTNLTFKNNQSTTQAQNCYDLKGVGYLEPEDALAKYYKVIEIIFKRLTSSGGGITSLEVEIVNAFSVLRFSLEDDAPSPRRYDAKSATNLIKSIGLEFGIGMLESAIYFS
ncbi:hypothetical protein [Pseudomonas fluorescens]|uniref:Uncharacterized protein n=1 Tax=Pseudomonas fluorescens TaxID=294 RepID=A0A0F4US48_PSEFL|nr:hypothetical protein [Pseudomonas fluorescens]KJZ59513.1 hypothetical protein VD17_30215 [Pseudomonas fluorescens]